MLVWRGWWLWKRLLLTERAKIPFGFTPPAEHVDQHGLRQAGASETETETIQLPQGPLPLWRFAATAREGLDEEVSLTAKKVRLITHF
jgi:hypothetical protein